MATLKRDSLVWRLLALSGGTFALAALAVFILVSHTVGRVVHDSSRDVYVQRVVSIIRTLDGQAAELQATDQADSLRTNYQDAVLRTLAQIHYDDPAAEIFPFIVDSTGSVLMHPRYPRGHLSFLNLIELPTLDLSGEGQFEFKGPDGHRQWAFFTTFEPWGWVVGYRVPHATVMADARRIQQLLIMVWAVVTLVVLGGLTIVLGHETRPLLELADAARAMADGDLECTVETGRPGEVGILARSFVDMRGAIRRQLSGLRESESRYRQIFDAMADALVVLDQDGLIVAANPRAAAVYGWSTQQLVGKPINSLLREDDQELGQVLRTPPADKPLAVTGFTRDHEGRDLETEIGAVRLEFLGQPHALVILRDVTAQRSLENQLLQSQKMELVGRLAGGIAHDFNNLLTPVLGYSEMLLEDSKPGSDTRADLEAILRAGQRARKLARQLLAFSRSQVLEMQDVDLGQTLADFEPILRRTLRENIDLSLVIDEDVGLVRADVGQVEQIIMNLAINAMDAMPNGGRLELVVSGRELDRADFATGPDLEPGRFACLRVRDTGHGVPPGIIDRIFEPFFTTKEAGKGTGLGLAAIHGIVQQHGGAISLRNLPAGGCEVELLLPCLPQEHGQVDSDRTERQQLARGHGETVILVEDDAMVRDLVERLLTRQGYVVRAFDSGQQCLDALAVAPEPADLLLSDVVMPGLSGPDLRDELAASGLVLPVLFMSGYVGDALSRWGLAEGRAEFLPKPVVPADLLRKLRELLES